MSPAEPASPSGDREGLFCTELPFMQKVWDSTSYGLLCECARKYYFTLILGYQKHPLPPPLWFGIFYHRGIETLAKARVRGDKHPILTAVKQVLKETYGYVSDDTRRTRHTLVRALVWYDEHYKNSPVEVVLTKEGKPAVELSFRFAVPIMSPDGDSYMMAGHLDAVVRFADNIHIMDAKTTAYALDSNWFAKFSPDTQMSFYSVSGATVLKEPAIGILVDGVQIGVNFNRFQRGFAPRTADQREEFMKDFTMNLRIAEIYARENHWPANEKSCDKYGGCPFREVCNKAPAVRENFLKSKFKIRPWNPLESR